MSEPRRPTAQQKLSKKELTDAWDDVFYDDATRGHDCINAHIAALSAELAALRSVIAELTAGEWAGFTGSRCQYCHCTFDSNHAPNCPVVRGRALLKGEQHE